MTATAVETVTGTATQMDALLAVEEGSTGDKVNLDGDFAINVDLGTATAAQLNYLIVYFISRSATSVTTISGSVSDLTTLVEMKGRWRCCRSKS